MLEQLQAYVNKRSNTGALDIKVAFIPLRPDELGTGLREGMGDVIAHGVVITPGRQQNFAFTVPTKKNATHIIVTGRQLANAQIFDHLVGVDIYVIL